MVKRILPGNCEDPEFVRMFAAEARILGILHHPNVVQAYDVGESDGTLFLVLEYVDGPSLGRLMRALRTAGRPLPPAFAGPLRAARSAGPSTTCTACATATASR